MMRLPPLQQIQWIGVDLYSPTCPSHTYVLSSLSLDTPLVSLVGILLSPLCIHCHPYQYSYRHTLTNMHTLPLFLSLFLAGLSAGSVFTSSVLSGKVTLHVISAFHGSPLFS